MRQGERERLKAERWMRRGKEVRAGWVGGRKRGGGCRCEEQMRKFEGGDGREGRKEREMEVQKGGRAMREENLKLSTSAVERRAEWWSMLAAL